MPSSREMRRQALDMQTARRRFLLKTLGLGAAGLAAGGAAAYAKGQLDDAATAGATLADLRVQIDELNTAKAALELSYSELQAQAAAWQTELTSANAQNAQLASALSTAQQDLANLQSQLAAVIAERDAANGRLARAMELIGLFDQLEAAGLDGVVENGLSAVAGAMAGIAGPAALLRSGIESARGLLTGFEQTLPTINGSMQWLGDQVVRLKVGLWAVESSAKETANSAITGVAAAFAGFVGFVIDHLPFNIGQRVRDTLAATQNVLANVTDMTDSAADQVLLKVQKHVDDGEQSWKRTLVAPLRDDTLAPAETVLTSVSDAGSAFTTALKDPATNALAQRRALREQIAAFRATHGV